MVVTTTIGVRDIHCESCERSIRTALSQLNAVVRVSPSRQSNQVVVSYDELALSEANLRDRLAELGFEAVG